MNPWVELDEVDQEPVYTKTVYEQEQQMLQMMYRHHKRRSATGDCWNELYVIKIYRKGEKYGPFVRVIRKHFRSTSESDSEPNSCNSVSEDSE